VTKIEAAVQIAVSALATLPFVALLACGGGTAVTAPVVALPAPASTPPAAPSASTPATSARNAGPDANAAAASIPVDGSPTLGPDDAPVTVVAFIDLECPPCRAFSAQIDATLAAHPNQVRIVYKAFPLSLHVHSEAAARTAFAAGLQGKFWEMERTLLEHQDHLESKDIEGYARGLKLDVSRANADAASTAATEHLARDRALGEALKLVGVPTYFVNGRELDAQGDASIEHAVAAALASHAE
jgi:protein-disulfide isomerase